MKHLRRWTIRFALERAGYMGTTDHERSVVVVAVSPERALLSALAQIEIRDDDTLHSVHLEYEYPDLIEGPLHFDPADVRDVDQLAFERER